MRDSTKELDAVQYSEAAIHARRLHFPPFTPCFRLHWHDRMELLRVREGSMTVEHGNAIFIVRAGEVVIIPPKTIHKGRSCEEGVVYDLLMFELQSFLNETAVCQQWLSALSDGTAKLRPVTADPATLRCLDTICTQEREASLGLISHVYALLDALVSNNLVSVDTHKKDAVIQACIAYIGENFHNELTVAALSEMFGYTPAHFSRKFKNVVGLTPIAYITILRLEEARKLLAHSAKSVGEIAALCGFADANYFTRCYKKHFGVPPSHYRK
ncbi:MAG: helix-turn-helix transcriptional regulator [Clostridia bacterium]|nr:helix-turn-helix transcriptional regulator [Clostridia bacterium]